MGPGEEEGHCETAGRRDIPWHRAASRLRVGAPERHLLLCLSAPPQHLLSQSLALGVQRVGGEWCPCSHHGPTQHWVAFDAAGRQGEMRDQEQQVGRPPCFHWRASEVRGLPEPGRPATPRHTVTGTHRGAAMALRISPVLGSVPSPVRGSFQEGKGPPPPRRCLYSTDLPGSTAWDCGRVGEGPVHSCWDVGSTVPQT